MKSNIIKAMLLAAIAGPAAAPAALAQVEVPSTPIGALVYGNSTITLESNEGTEMVVPTHARYNFAVSSADWITTSAAKDRITLSIEDNPNATSRTALLTLRGAQGVSTTLSVYQPGWDIASSAVESYNAGFAVPVRSKDAAKNSAGRAQSSDPLKNSYDGDLSTLYHSNWNGFDMNDPDQWPVLEYYFTLANAPQEESVDIAAITYCPRREGGENGRFGVVKIEVGTWGNGGDDLVWTPITDQPIDFKMSASDTTVPIPENMQKGIRAIRFTVQSGAQNGTKPANMAYASCAEMRFKRPADPTSEAGKAVFADAVCSKLKPGTTQAQIDAISDPFYQQLAQAMLDGTYDGTQMTSTHNALKSPQTLAEEMNAPGKCYDQTAGVTGVALTPGTYAIIVDGIPVSKGTVDMKLTYWHGHEQYKDENDNSVSWNVDELSFSLSNGVNIINVPMPWRREDHRVDGDVTGLVYINNFDDDAAAAGLKNPVSVHIVGGLYNGYLTNYNTNAENQAILDNAVYPCIDLLGTRVHSVWQVSALKQYSAGQYVRYINLLDQLIVWEHRVLGLDKYDRIPENRTMTYVNYSYYMFQGGRGPTFMYNTQYRVCNPDNLMNSDSDAIWGLSHEWGHQHQMAPYFRWTGMAEVSNNIFSAYNVAHMGYPIATNPGRYPRDKWQSYIDRTGKEVPAHIQKIFINDDYNRTITAPDENGETKTANDNDNIVMSLRSDAAKAARNGSAFAWNNKLKQFAINQPKYPSKRFASDAVYSEAAQNTVNPRTALNAIEAYSSNNGELILGPYINLMYYFAEHGNPDLWPDVFESLRQNDFEHGSSVEPGKTEVDKYELLTSIFNGNKATGCNVDKTAQFKAMFPNSCWTTEGYIDAPAGQVLNWQQNSGPAIMNCIRKLSMNCGYNLWSYFERFGVFTVCAIEQGDYGTQYYIMTDDMYDEFKADMDALVANGTLKPLTEEMRQAITNAKATEIAKPTIPNDRPLLGSDN